MRPVTAPRFTVVIPLYNKRPYIGRAVSSVLAQTLTEFELIVVDDGSTDGSADVLSDVRDPRLKVVHQENSGVGPARNTGLNLARGDWVAFLDADDAWMECHLAELNRVAVGYPMARLISTACVEATGSEVPGGLACSLSTSVVREVDYFMEASRNMGFVNATSAAVRRDVVSEIGYFSAKKTGEDLEYWIKAALKYRVAVSNRVTCVYFRDTCGVIQRITQEGAAMTEPPLLSIRELSTPMALLYTMAEHDSTLLLRPNIRAYINGVLHVAVRGSLYRGHFRHARHYSSMFLAPLGPRDYFFRIALRLPDFLLRLLRNARLQTRKG